MRTVSSIARTNIAAMDDGTLETLRSYFIASAECAVHAETKAEAAAFLLAIQAEINSRSADLLAGDQPSVRHWWPLGESRPMCADASPGDVTGDPKGVTCPACRAAINDVLPDLLAGEPL